MGRVTSLFAVVLLGGTTIGGPVASVLTTIAGPRTPFAMCAAAVPLGDSEPSQFLSVLREQGIICSERDGNLRLSIHFYNDEDDIERLATALASARGSRSAPPPQSR